MILMNISIIAFLEICFNLLVSLRNSKKSKFLYQISFRVLRREFSPFNPNVKMPASSLGFIATLNTEIVTQDSLMSENVCGVYQQLPAFPGYPFSPLLL